MIGIFTAAENRERVRRLQQAEALALRKNDLDEAVECRVAWEEIQADLDTLDRAERGYA